MLTPIEKLQEQLAFQERTIEQLNAALSDQQQQIIALSEELRLAVQLMQQWRESNNTEAGEQSLGITHEIPPHY